MQCGMLHKMSISETGYVLLRIISFRMLALSNCQWNLDFGFLELNSAFRSPRFQIPEVKTSRILDCKTVSFFFSKSVKKSVKRGVRVFTRAKHASLSPVSLSVFSLVPDLLFYCSRVLEYAKIQTVLQSTRIPESVLPYMPVITSLRC